MTPEDWPAVKAIYEEGIATKQATFETEAPNYETWDAGHLEHCRLVATVEEVLIGWVALLPVSGRHVYRGVAEVNIYVAGPHRGVGIGDALMAEMIEQSAEAGIWTLQSVVFPENKATLRLHARHGFRQVGKRERIGQMDGVWRDTLLLERRSANAG